MKPHINLVKTNLPLTTLPFQTDYTLFHNAKSSQTVFWPPKSHTTHLRKAPSHQ